MSEPLYLLDTNVVLFLVRGDSRGKSIDQQFGLRTAKQRPLISVVTVGEARVLAARNGWGEQKLAALNTALDELVVIDINHTTVIDAYVELDLASYRPPELATWARTTSGSRHAPRHPERSCSRPTATSTTSSRRISTATNSRSSGGNP